MENKTCVTQVQRELIAALEHSAVQERLGAIRKQGLSVDETWDELLGLVLQSSLEVLESHGWGNNQAALIDFNQQLMAEAKGDLELAALVRRKWQLLLGTAFGVDARASLGLEQTRQLVLDITKQLCHPSFSLKVDQTLATLSKGASLIEKRRALLPLIHAVHHRVIEASGLQGEAAYLSAKLAMLDYSYDPLIVDAYEQVQQQLFSRL